MPPIDWSLSDYTSMMLSLLDRLGVERAAFVGHSFGGRIAVDIASRTNRAERLVLVDAAGLRPRKGPIKRLRALRFRISRRLGLDTEKFYSADWRALPERMRGVFARVVAGPVRPTVVHSVSHADRLGQARQGNAAVYG